MSVQIVTGGDTVLVAKTVSTLTDELLGENDRALALTQLREDDFHQPESGWSITPLIEAAQTPPLFTDRRVVVGRHLARFSRPADHAALLDMLPDMLATTDLLLVWERGQQSTAGTRLPPVPKKLAAAVRSAGGKVVKTDAPFRKNEGDKWLREQIAETGLRFERAAMTALRNLLGQDRSRVVGCLHTLEGALGSDATVTADDVAAYGGDPGSAAPWDLDDAIDRGDIKTAIEVLHRQLPSRHPFQLLAGLHGRYQRMLRLDGSGIRDEAEAAQILGIKGSTFPARKLLQQTHRLGSAKIAQAIKLLADADMAMRGTIAWPNQLVMEVLVARLADLTSR